MKKIVYCYILGIHDFQFMKYFTSFKFWDKIEIKWCYRCKHFIGEYNLND
jgi:hypothetical protein